MKGMLSAIMLMICLLLIACNAALEEPSGDSLIGAPSPESCATAMQHDTAYKRDITLVLNFGVKTGHYTGELVDGLPHGQGTFKSQNSEGVGWEYVGEWNMGHMQGEGITRFETGYKLTGWYESDYLCGEGSLFQYDHLLFEGNFVESIPDGQGTFYSYCGEIIYSGLFTKGFIDETNDARIARVGLFKESCITSDYDTLTESALTGGNLHAKLSGTVSDVLESGGLAVTCNFIMELPDGNMVGVSYILSEGERPVSPGDKVDVWGIADCLVTHSYTQVSIPEIKAWDVQDSMN